MSNLEKITPKITPEKKRLDTETTKVSIDLNEEKDYTISPDGKYKYLKSEFDSDRLEENNFNIPQINIPGWIVCWPHDLKANTIPYMFKKGWIFVNPKEKGCEEAARKIVAGRTQAGETAFHYAMKMPECKFRELQAREEKGRVNLLEGIKKAPSEETNAIYATEQMK